MPSATTRRAAARRGTPRLEASRERCARRADPRTRRRCREPAGGRRVTHPPRRSGVLVAQGSHGPFIHRSRPSCTPGTRVEARDLVAMVRNSRMLLDQIPSPTSVTGTDRQLGVEATASASMEIVPDGSTRRRRGPGTGHVATVGISDRHNPDPRRSIGDEPPAVALLSPGSSRFTAPGTTPSAAPARDRRRLARCRTADP